MHELLHEPELDLEVQPVLEAVTQGPEKLLSVVV